jgi:TolA-binding protein
MNDNNEQQLNTAPIDELEQLRKFLHTHGMTLVIGICLLIAAIILPILYRNHIQKQTTEASEKLFTAKTTKDFEELISQYPSTPASPLADLKLAKMYFDSAKYDISLDKYLDFKEKYPQHELLEVAEMGRLHCMEAKAQLEDALAGFSLFAQKHPEHFLMPQAVLGQGRCMEQMGRNIEAKALYEDFIAKHPESAWSQRMEEVLQTVNKKIEP